MITALCTALALLASPVTTVATASSAAPPPVGAAAAPATAARAVGAAPQWGSCDGPAARTGVREPSSAYRCATVRVPLDHRDPARGTLGIPVVRISAEDPDRRIGTLVLQPGGPGTPGVDFALGNHADLPAELRERFDVVGFDARGVGRAGQVRCWDDTRYAREIEDAAGLPGPDAFGRAVASARDFGAACARESGERLPYLGTGYVARDLDLVREALGEERISFYGRSFGSYVGTVYADVFPDRVRAMVLDGAYDPVAYGQRPYDFDLAQFVALDQAVGRLLDWCAGTPRRCAFGDGDPHAAFGRLLRDLDADPVTVPGRGTANGFTLVHRLMFNMNTGRSAWPGIASALALAEARDPSSFLLSPPSSDSFDFLTANVVVECDDRAYPEGDAELAERLRAAAAAAPRLGPAMAYGPPTYDHNHAPACTRWPAERAGAHDGPFRAAGTPPTLVMGTTGDPDTPYQDAVTLAGMLEKARLLTFEAEGHTAFGRSRCARQAVVDHLVGGTPPPRDLVCSDESDATTSSDDTSLDLYAAPGTVGADEHHEVIGRPGP